ncbi:MAG TPA: MFS transporter [Acidimicrobiales bacterium]|nr:MFS transporter [Acidimicrobiales bacterium]
MSRQPGLPTVLRQPGLRTVAGGFAAFGTFWGAWAVSVADIERSLGLSHASFGLFLSAALVAAAGSNAVAGSLCERWGTRRTFVTGLVVWSVLLAAAAAAPDGALTGLAIGVSIVAAGGVDVAMNVAATAGLVDEPGRLVRFHSFFNVGAAAGAAIAGTVLHAGLSWRWIWLFAGVVMLTLGAVSRRSPMPAAAGSPEPQSLLSSLRAVRGEGLVLLAVIFACGAMVEGGIDTWGVLYLREKLAVGVLAGASAYTIGQLVATASRAGLGPRAGRLGSRRGVAAGAGVAAAGMVALCVGRPVPLAAAGLAVAAGGVSMCWPLLMALTGSGRQRPANAVGGVSSIGYLGFVVGPALVGWLASVAGLRAGLALLAAAAGFVAVAASRLTSSGTRRGRYGLRP